MKNRLSKRISLIKPSATLSVASKAAKLKSLGHDIISLSVGEPDFDTAKAIKQAGIEAIEQGFTKYTAVEGIYALRQAVADKFRNDNGLSYKPEQILVSNGAKQSFYNLAQALLNPGDEVIIPAPYWVSYLDMVLLTEATPVVIPTSSATRFKITPEDLRGAITSKTRLVVINSPSNPSGMAYSREELRALSLVLLDFPEILIASDDIYEHILWSKEPYCNILMVCPELWSRVILIHGVSKTHAMTGWRIGYAAGPDDLIEAMTRVQSQSTSNACSISQRAALSALTMDQHIVEEQVAIFHRRHDYVVEAINNIAGLSCLPGDGTFYVFIDARGAMEKLSFSCDTLFAEYLLTTIGVAWVPGEAFGLKGYARLSFATEIGLLQDAMQRLRTLLGARETLNT